MQECYPSLANHSDNTNQQTPAGAAGAAGAAGCSMRDTCLHVAATDGLSSCILMLCNAGAILNAKNRRANPSCRSCSPSPLRQLKSSSIMQTLEPSIALAGPLQYMLGKDAMASESARLANLSLPAPPPLEWAGFSQMLGSEEFADLCLISSDVKRFSVTVLSWPHVTLYFRALFQAA